MTPNPFHNTMLLSNPVGQFADDLERLSERITSILHSTAKSLGVIKCCKTRGECALNKNLTNIYIDFSMFFT